MKTILQRFEEKFTKMDGCWVWNSPPTDDGYGQFWLNGGQPRAHRVSWILYVGEIPEGKMVLHTCDNRMCVNPEHLFIGTALDNILDCKAKGRNARGEMVGGAKLTEEKVRTIIRDYKDGGYTHRSLANRFGVTKGTITHILKGRNWAHLGGV